MDTDYTDAEGAEHDLNDTTKTVLVTGGSNPGVYSYAEYTERFGGDEDNYFVSDTIPSVTQQDLEKAEGTDGSAYAVAGGEDIGFDAGLGCWRSGLAAELYKRHDASRVRFDRDTGGSAKRTTH